MGEMLERYRAGQHEAVWDGLFKLRDLALSEEYRPDAEAVAQETMRRARHNVDLLVPRLDRAGFRFLNTPHESNVIGLTDQFNQLEELVGPLPLSWRHWQLEVGGVCLMGDHKVLCGYNIALASEALVDPLVVFPPEATVQEYEMYREDGEAEFEEDWEFRLLISPDILHKQNISGADPDEIRAEVAADGLLLRSEQLDVPFVSYLRESFRWAGFPGWRGREDAPMDLIRSLTEGFLAL